MPRRIPLAVAALVLIASPGARGGDAPARLAPNSADEPFGAFSIERGEQFLDAVSVDWTRRKQCGTCHTNYARMIAGPLSPGEPSAGVREVRAFFESRAANWDKPDRPSRPIAEGEILATASALALNDSATTGKLHPLTRAALDRIWTTQRPDGSWAWFDCDYPPLEDDDYYGAVLAAVAVGHAPEKYKDTAAARPGLDKLRGYLRATPPPHLHHRAMLLWASTGVDGLMEAAGRDRTVADLLALQRPDGGWSLPSLGSWRRRDGTANPADAPSDGYGTGYVVYVLRQGGVPADAEPVRRGVGWLKAHQRASGRWFTRSPTIDHSHYLTHAGTGYALMALAACGEK